MADPGVLGSSGSSAARRHVEILCGAGREHLHLLGPQERPHARRLRQRELERGVRPIEPHCIGRDRVGHLGKLAVDRHETDQLQQRDGGGAAERCGDLGVGEADPTVLGLSRVGLGVAACSGTSRGCHGLYVTACNGMQQCV